jgi:hypothetical protein
VQGGTASDEGRDAIGERTSSRAEGRSDGASRALGMGGERDEMDVRVVGRAAIRETKRRDYESGECRFDPCGGHRSSLCSLSLLPLLYFTTVVTAATYLTWRVFVNE